MNNFYRLAALLLVGAFLTGCGTQSLMEQLNPSAVATKPPADHVLPIDATVALVPLTGPTAQVANDLARDINLAAQDAQLALVVESSAQADYQLQGFLVAAKDQRGVEVTYVWDVYNKARAKLKRVSGRKRVAGVSDHPDVWQSIPPSIYREIAQEVVAAVVMVIRIQSKVSPIVTAQPP